MTFSYDKLQESYLGYAAVYVCISLGFLILRGMDKKEIGPGYWAVSFLFNALGFTLWSGAIPLTPTAYYLLGEVCHIIGFVVLVAGAYRFFGKPYRKWNAVFLLALVGVWCLAIALFRDYNLVSGFLVKAVRAVIFLSAAYLLLRERAREKLAGITMAGYSLAVWGTYIMVFAFITLNPYIYVGFLVGFHVLAAFGMVAMVLDKIRLRAEISEERVAHLEGILPICSYCKKIRDESNQWQRVEEYIEDRSKAQFSHGICPDCFEKHKPDQ